MVIYVPARRLVKAFLKEGRGRNATLGRSSPASSRFRPTGRYGQLVAAFTVIAVCEELIAFGVST